MNEKDIHYVNVYDVDGKIVIAEDFGQAADIYRIYLNTSKIKNISCLAQDAPIFKKNVLQES